MDMEAQISRRLRDPLTWAEASQLAKTVVAAVVAWALAVHVFGLSQAFMAPWAALLTVHITVFGSLRRAASRRAPLCSGCSSRSLDLTQ